MGSDAGPEVVAIGETMAMVVATDAGSLRTASRFELHAGGAESNVACHLARLGVRAAWASALGCDALGDRVLRTIADRGVDVRWVVRDPTAPTGVYFKDPGDGVAYYRAGSAASRMNTSTFRDVPIERAAVVHLSGITPALSASCAALVEDLFRRVAPTATLLSFDVNHRPGLWTADDAAPVLRRLADRADVVFVGLDEAAGLWGCRDADEVRDLLPGPERLVVKDGDVGATEFGPAGQVFVPALPTEVVEAVGAGDAFAAGYLAAMLQGDDGPSEAAAAARLRAGHTSAGLVLRSVSDLDALAEPTDTESRTR